MTSVVQNIIAVLNTNSPNILMIQRAMLIAQVGRAAKHGDVTAQRYIALCNLNTTSATKH